MMKPPTIDPNEQSFVERALAASTRAQRWEKARVIATTIALVAVVVWFVLKPSGAVPPIMVIILVLLGVMSVAGRIHSGLTQRNTMQALQAIADRRPQGDSAPPPPGPSK